MVQVAFAEDFDDEEIDDEDNEAVFPMKHTDAEIVSVTNVVNLVMFTLGKQ